MPKTKTAAGKTTGGEDTPSLPYAEDEALKVLREFARESRLTLKKPVRQRFGNRYVSPPN